MHKDVKETRVEQLPVNTSKEIQLVIICSVHLFSSSPLRLLHPINMHYQVLTTDISRMSNHQSIIVPIFNRYSHAMNGL